MKKNSSIMKAVIFIAVLFIPIIYSFFYLKSYWDPYKDLTGMKIAIVNLDKGLDEKNRGTEFVDGLKESGTFEICEVEEDVAEKGMEDGKYYATITIPEDFTMKLSSAAEEDKQIAVITYKPNQASNYLATQIINSAVKTMEANLQSKINKEIATQLADKLREVPESLQTISEGADEILEGSQSLNSGLEKLNNGTSTLNSSYDTFDKGVKTVSGGMNTLDSSISQINGGLEVLESKGTEGITNLVNNFGLLAAGAKKVSDGASGVAESLNKNILNSESALMKQAGISSASELETKKAALEGAMQAYGMNTTNPATGNTFIKDYQSLCQAQGAISALEGAKASITASANDSSSETSLYALAAGAKQVSDGANQLASTDTAESLKELSGGITTLKEAMTEVKGGTSTLQSGLATLDGSSTEVKNALTQLNEGTQTAYEGSTQLTNGVNKFDKAIKEGKEETENSLKVLDGIENFAEDPVEFKTEAYGKVESYGVAFTPLFLSIGLWVGALMGYVVLYYDQRNRFKVFGKNGSNKFVQNALYIAIGAVEGIITGVLLKAGLGFEVENYALYIASSMLIGVSFTAIMQFLIRNFGDIGKFLALIILVLQLAASGGTFPVETIAKGFQKFTAFLPMTYAIKLLREVLVPTGANYKGRYILILSLVTIILVALTYAVDIVKAKNEKNNKEEKEA